MAVDTSGDGDLTMEELNTGLKGIGVNLSKDELEAVFSVCDEDGGGSVDMNEACVCMRACVHMSMQAFVYL